MFSSADFFTRLPVWPVPIPPTPMTPMRMRSLAPAARAWLRAVRVMAPVARAEVFTKSRRVCAFMFGRQVHEADQDAAEQIATGEEEQAAGFTDVMIAQPAVGMIAHVSGQVRPHVNETNGDSSRRGR